ncbi:MAG: hypothetical protein JRJ12_09270 [Deltaproteobacteria bacterium]|nr:hypothetical protein [Deltaproteobacteria bacterium]MBW2070606.1 hypothetical protein [Deltaproteobacteria bacterium]
MRLHGMLSYYESKIKLLDTPNIDEQLLRMGCWDAPVEASGLSDPRKYRQFIKKCRKYYNKKIEGILHKPHGRTSF